MEDIPAECGLKEENVSYFSGIVLKWIYPAHSDTGAKS
jgi:hypothetical protein